MYNMEKREKVSLSKDDAGEYPVRKKSGRGRLFGFLLAFILVVIIIFVVVSNNKPAEKVLDVGSIAQAKEVCEEYIKKEISEPGTVKFKTQTPLQDTRFPTHYQAVGSVETGDDAVNPGIRSFKCDMHYLPETKTWSVETFFNG